MIALYLHASMYIHDVHGKHASSCHRQNLQCMGSILQCIMHTLNVDYILHTCNRFSSLVSKQLQNCMYLFLSHTSPQAAIIL